MTYQTALDEYQECLKAFLENLKSSKDVDIDRKTKEMLLIKHTADLRASELSLIKEIVTPQEPITEISERLFADCLPTIAKLTNNFWESLTAMSILRNEYADNVTFNELIYSIDVLEDLTEALIIAAAILDGTFVENYRNTQLS